MRTVTVYGSGKYFNTVQTIELHVTFDTDPYVKVEMVDGAVSVVRARCLGTERWHKLAGDTLEALGRHCMKYHGEPPSEELLDAWAEATEVVWRRALAEQAERHVG